MASLYPRPRSPYWWLEYIDAAGERQQKSTKYRRDVPAQSRQARQLRDDLTAREVAAKSSGIGGGPEIWQAWVPRFIAQRYGTSITAQRAIQCWRNLTAYLDAIGVAVPRQLTRQQVRDFIEWREQDRAESGTRRGAKNTALLEIKFLGLIMDEAIASGFADANPCHRLGIGRDEPERKPRITDDEHRLITRALKLESEWMRVSYKIAWEQGCRFSETMIDLCNVDLTRNVLGLRTKGKKERIAEVPLAPGLRPLFRRLIKQGRKYTFQRSDLPKGGFAKAFWKFFRKIELPHLSFHSTRVTLITRLREAGIAEPDVMLICLHASTTVHRIYPRLPASGRYLQDAMARLAAARRAA
jgi:integrase